VPKQEIHFRILEGYGVGTEDSIIFEEIGDKTRAVLHFVPLHIMSIIPGIKESEEYHSLLSYFVNQDTQNLEGKWAVFEQDQECPKCKRGKLVDTGKKEDTITNKERITGKYFKCMYCGEEYSNFRLEI
jgi:hypothetical protein